MAESETLVQKIIRFSSSDLLEGEVEGGLDIQTFAKKYKNDEYRPAGYTTSYPITDKGCLRKCKRPFEFST